MSDTGGSLWSMLLRRYRGPEGKNKSQVDEEVKEKTNRPQERGSSGERGMGGDKRDSSIPPPAR
jgi:hypothetical protein